MTDTATDTKAGFCSNCRREDHSLCASSSCACPDKRKHRNRPGFGEVAAPAPRPLRPVPASKPAHAAKPQPMLELVAEEPPEPERKLSLLEQVVEMVRDGEREPGRWYRVAIMPTTRTAKALATKLTKHEITERMRLEWRAADLKVFVKGPA